MINCFVLEMNLYTQFSKLIIVMFLTILCLNWNDLKLNCINRLFWNPVTKVHNLMIYLSHSHGLLNKNKYKIQKC